MSHVGSGRGDQLSELVRGLVSQAGPAEQVEAVAGWRSVSSARSQGARIEAQRAGETGSVGVRVLVGDRVGFAHAGSLEPDVLSEVLDEARANAAVAEPDPHAGLVSADGLEPVTLERPAPDLVSPAELAELALELERLVTSLDPRVSGVRVASVAQAHGWTALASSTGIELVEESSSGSVSVTALAHERGETQVGGGVDAGHRLADCDPRRAATEAVERAVELLGATKPPSQRLPVMLDARAVAALMSIVGGMCGGDRVAKGRTPFAERRGEQVASSALTLVDDPTDERSLGAETHDGEGLASRRTPVIESGVLVHHLHDGLSARRCGESSTASAVRGVRSTPTPAPRALALVPGPLSSAELRAGLDQGLWVSALAGLHSGVNAVSGDLSVGVSGRRIRGGELAEPVREATIASSIQRLLLELVAVGSDLVWLPSGTGAAPVLLGEVSVSGR